MSRVKSATVIPLEVVKRKTKVMWGIPLDELTYSRWAMYLISMPRHPEDKLAFIISTYVPFARNSIHQEFLKSDFQWLMMLDSDVIPPLDIVDVLLGRGQKVVSGWYNTKMIPKRPVVYHEENKQDKWGNPLWMQYDKPSEGLEKVDGVGAGIMLMHKDVAVALGEKPYDETEGGEDLTLCRRIRAAGFDIYVDWSMGAKHCGIAIY